MRTNGACMLNLRDIPAESVFGVSCEPCRVGLDMLVGQPFVSQAEGTLE
jgi:hypothetical protein